MSVCLSVSPEVAQLSGFESIPRMVLYTLQGLAPKPALGLRQNQISLPCLLNIDFLTLHQHIQGNWLLLLFILSFSVLSLYWFYLYLQGTVWHHIKYSLCSFFYCCKATILIKIFLSEREFKALYQVLIYKSHVFFFFFFNNIFGF